MINGNSLPRDEIDDRDLRRREKADGGAPGPRPSADMQKGVLGQSVVTAVEGKEAACDQAEGKDLPPMGMAGELEVERTGRVVFNQGLMFEQDRETIAALKREDLSVRQSTAGADAARRRIVNACQIDNARHGRDLAA